MKLFFASDLHGSLPATENTLEKYRASGAEHLILLGDILNHGPRNPVPEGYQPSEVANRLNHYSEQIIAVRGNCDSEVDQMLLTFPMMESYSWVLLETGQRFFLTHGHLYNEQHLPCLRRNDVVVHGHSHLPCAKKVGQNIVFNPGSVTFPKGGFEASYGTFNEGVLDVFNFLDESIARIEV